MSESVSAQHGELSALHRPMRGRDPGEPHRASTPLELLFDLCFVVAVALAADRLHHALAEGQPQRALPSYAMVFFAIWWAWVNFTWFASSYDNDDVPYRLATLAQIARVLILVAGLPRAFDRGDFGVVVAGYIVLRVTMIVQWLRVAHANEGLRPVAMRYVIGISVCQIGWIARLALPAGAASASFGLLALAEMLVPVWATRRAPSTWHPGHIAERYGLFTLIVLGESILAATSGIQAAIDAGAATTNLLVAAGSALLIVFAMWWVYFGQPTEAVAPSAWSTFVWGYGHLLIFASAAAVGAGLQVNFDQNTGAISLPASAAGLALAVPVALYLCGVWALHTRASSRGLRQAAASAVVAVLVLATVVTPWPLPLIALLLVGRVGAALTFARHTPPIVAGAHARSGTPSEHGAA